MTTSLFFIRHGITDWNRQGRYCGWKDVSLSKQGREQVRRLAFKLAPLKFDKIYVSDRKRCLQTAGIIFKRAKVTRLSSLREIRFGVLEGLKHKEILKKYGNSYKLWLSDPDRNRLAGIEPTGSFKKRVIGSIKKICRDNPGKNVAIVCHGGVIGVFMSTILKNNNFWCYIPKAASLTIIKYKQGRFLWES